MNVTTRNEVDNRVQTPLTVFLQYRNLPRYTGSNLNTFWPPKLLVQYKVFICPKYEVYFPHNVAKF